MGAGPLGALASPDSVHVASVAYGASLLVTLPLAAALLLMGLLHGRAAADRVAVLRATLVSVLLIMVGPLLPFGWAAWVLPGELSVPIVRLGIAHMQRAAPGPWLVGLALTWTAGVVLLLAPLVMGRLRWRRWWREARRPEPGLARQVRAMALACGAGPRVSLRTSPWVTSPGTWGTWHPRVVWPASATAWSSTQVHAALWHELEHVRAHDAAWMLLARVVRALLWFQPLSWWLVARLEREVELACDEAVLARGVRRSDYAELLAHLAEAPAVAAPALGLGPGRGGLRQRLHAIVATPRPSATSRSLQRLLLVAGVVPGLALGSVEVVPTRAVLSTLLADGQWETRAWAAVRLAQRPDTVALALRAAERDPNPRVRAWARYALEGHAAPQHLPRD